MQATIVEHTLQSSINASVDEIRLLLTGLVTLIRLLD